jgi:hypothetical protein
MSKRQLNDQEKKFTEKAVKRKQKELEMWRVQERIEQADFDVLEDKFKLLRYSKGQTIKELKMKSEVLEKELEIYNDQLTNGVESKDSKEE